MGAPSTKSAISTPAKQRKRPIKARGLKKADRDADLFCIGSGWDCLVVDLEYGSANDTTKATCVTRFFVLFGIFVEPKLPRNYRSGTLYKGYAMAGVNHLGYSESACNFGTLLTF